MKILRKWLDAIMLKIGYIPVDTPVNIIKEPIGSIVEVKATRVLHTLVFQSKIAHEMYMNDVLKALRQEVADKASDFFEVTRYSTPSQNPLLDQDLLNVSVALKIISK